MWQSAPVKMVKSDRTKNAKKMVVRGQVWSVTVDRRYTKKEEGKKK